MVQGIGTTILERMRPLVCVNDDDAIQTPVLPLAPAARDSARAASLFGTASAPSQARSKKAEQLTERIDVNLASVPELQRLPGIGPKLAQRIANERAKQPFASVAELRRVPGIGPKTLEKLRPHVAVESDPQRVARSP